MMDNQFIVLTSNSYKQIIKQNDIQRRHEFQNICLYETSKVGVLARIKFNHLMAQNSP
jgi:hypothetical protein